MTTIFTYSADGEMQQRATSPPFKTINEHEGLALADIDGDGKPDIVGGGYWFKRLAGDRYEPNTIDAGYHFSRAASGQLIEGGRPEVVLVVGDGVGPLVMYEWVKGTWVPHVLIEKIDNGHSLSLVDFNGDGHLDIFCAEMRLDGGNTLRGRQGRFHEVCTDHRVRQSRIKDSRSGWKRHTGYPWQALQLGYTAPGHLAQHGPRIRRGQEIGRDCNYILVWVRAAGADSAIRSGNRMKGGSRIPAVQPTLPRDIAGAMPV